MLQIGSNLTQVSSGGVVNGTILVVDDDSASCALTKEVLSAQGYVVHTAADGPTGLQAFVQLKPDLILLDVRMPGLGGFDFCRQIKANPETRLIPVILVTGLSAKQDRIKGIEVGADDFLSKPADHSELLTRVRSLLNLKAYTDELERAESVLFALARSIEAKDPHTEGHCERLSEYSAQLAMRIGLPEGQLTALRRAGVVHDIGKVAIPESVLLKPGPLTPEERTIVKRHPVVGERICAPLKSFRLVLPVIRHHHERFNGTGYPDGLKGEQIPLTARVLQIVDVYDALTTQRPYKNVLSCGEALTTMKKEVENGWWDPYLFREFHQMLTETGPPDATLSLSPHSKEPTQ